MNTLILSLLLLQAPGGAPKIQTLIITGQNGHDWRATTPLLRKALEDTGKFEVRVMEEFRGAGPEALAPYDLVVLNYFERRRPELRWGERADNALLEFVRSGKGLVMYHFSTAAFDGWQEYEKMSGGNWRPNQGHHSAPHDFTVDIKDPDHPITRGLKKSFPQAKDELYANLRWQPAKQFHVLATAYDDHALYQGKARQPIPGPGLDHPMLWTVQYGKGRVFGTALGHDAAAVGTPAFVVTYQRGAEWAATGSVTIPVPAALAP
jgi:type 1 glutamine amidotransferase